MRARKGLIILLALVLIFSQAASVFATDYYEEWGPMWDWTDEQWEASESWTEAEWNAYYEAENAAWEKEYKESMGFTNLDGINVFFDGVCLDFKDVTPVLRNGSTMVPFRTIFEAFGAKVDYKQEDGKKIITASLDDITLTLTAGQLSMTVVKGSSTETVTLSAAPYLAKGRAFVPLRAISEGLGYDVLWNEWDQVVEIIDGETLIAEIDKRFSLYNRMVADSASAYDPEITYKSKGKVSFDATLYGDEKDSVGSLKSNFTSLQKGLDLDMKGTIQLDLNDFSESLTYLLGEDMMKELSAVKDTPVDLIMDGDSFNMYLKSPLFALYLKNILSWYAPYDEEAATPAAPGKNDWVQFSLSDAMGMAYSSALGEEYLSLFKDPSKLTFGKIMYLSVVPEDGNTWGVNLYKQMASAADLSEVFFGDVNFVKKGSSYVLKLNRMDLVKQLGPIVAAEMGEVNVNDALALLNDIPEAEYQVVLTEKGGLLKDMAMSGHVKLRSAVPVTIAFNLSADDKTSNFDFSIVGRYFGKMVFHADSVTAETKETLRTAPPSGENVYNLTELFNPQSTQEGEPVGISDLWESSDSIGASIIPNRVKGLIHYMQLPH